MLPFMAGVMVEASEVAKQKKVLLAVVNGAIYGITINR